MTELTVADIAAREGFDWPTADPDDPPRHLLDEPDPQPGALVAFWFGAPAPRGEQIVDEQPPRLARPYAPPIKVDRSGA